MSRVTGGPVIIFRIWKERWRVCSCVLYEEKKSLGAGGAFVELHIQLTHITGSPGRTGKYCTIFQFFPDRLGIFKTQIRAIVRATKVYIYQSIIQCVA